MTVTKSAMPKLILIACQRRRVNLFYIERVASVFIDVGCAEFMWEREVADRQHACNLLDRAF
jgi:hypothetical protein